MILKDISFNTPQENILYDEVLLHLAEQDKGGEVLRFWESRELFIVLGRICKEREDVKINAVHKNPIPVLRRCSGGGTVLQGKGCLNYSLILSKEHNPQISDLRRSYQFILDKVISALKQCHVEAVFCPISDIALAENHKKISGSAQKRSKKFILHHGTVLYDFDIQKIEQYLKIPKDVPEYRRGRSHMEFVANVPLTAQDIKEALNCHFDVDQKEDRLNNEEQDCLQSFLQCRKGVFLNTKNISIELPGQ